MAKDTGKKLIDMMYGQNPDQAAFGVYPQLKPKRTAQDPQAAKNVPVDLLRGAVSGVLGAPGDIESLIRLLPGLDENTVLPTSEDIEKRLPFKSDTPVSRAATGLGQIGGGFYTGPGSPFRLVGSIPGALKHGAQEFAKASAGSASHVIKPKGGNWMSGSVEKALKRLKSPYDPDVGLEDLRQMREQHGELPAYARDEQTMLQAKALNNWVDRNLTNYVKKEMATPEDPVRKLADEGILHFQPQDVYLSPDTGFTRTEAGYPRHGMGKSQLAIDWEALSDKPVGFGTAGEMINIGKGEPWMEKVDPFTRVHGIAPMEQGSMARDLGFDHIIDVLREDLASGHIRPEQLNKVSMEQAVRRTYEYDQELAAKMAQARSAQRAELPVYKEYPEGYRWIELNKPGAFASESEAMGHSVRGYEPPQGHPDWIAGSGDRGSLGYGHGGWEAIKSGKAKVYSLVDSKGNPHVTVEVGKERKNVDPLSFYQSENAPQSLLDRISEAEKSGALDDIGALDDFVMASPEYHEYINSGPSRITQIKGKQNLAPGDEYLPFVQDFVKSGQWSDVGDLQNTGLIRRGNVFTPTEKQGLIDLGQDVPEYLTQEDIARLRRARGDLPPEDGMAHGGRVHISEDPDVMQMELAGGGLVKGLAKAAKAVKAGADAPKPIVEAPGIIIPGTISRVKEAVRESKGDYGAKRIERAADEIRNLEKLYKEQALRDAFGGDNAKALMTMNPADFEKYAVPLNPRFLDESSTRYTTTGERLSYPEYMENYLPNVGAFNDVPFLEINKKAQGTSTPPFISGHEGRHRSRVMTNRGDQAGLVRLLPRAELREPLPRRSQEEYIEALREELELSNRMVRPESHGSDDDLHLIRPAIQLPDIYAEGGEVNMAGGGGALAKLAKLARAPAKTKQEIEAIAERIAPQVTGEYVRSKPGSAITVAGKTKKQFEREKSLPVDIRATAAERVPEPVDIEKLKGEVMIGIPGDPTVTGKTLHGVGDVRLESPAPQHGGPLYGLYHDDDHFWASGLGAARRVQNLAKEAGEQYDAPVVGKYVMMGPESINYAQHFADANLQAIDLSKMTKKQVEQFNKLIRQGSPASGPRPSFPGIEDKESAYLQMAMDPELRKHFNQLMQQNTVTEALNLPSGQDIRFAITEPPLRDLETGVTGFSMGRMRPDIPAAELKLSEHPTYSHDIPGHFMGQTAYPVPYELSFPDTLKAIRENPKQAPHEFGSLKMVGPRQTIDQQLIDELKMYEERMKALTGKADGGEVTADDLILEERKL